MKLSFFLAKKYKSHKFTINVYYSTDGLSQEFYNSVWILLTLYHIKTSITYEHSRLNINTLYKILTENDFPDLTSYNIHPSHSFGNDLINILCHPTEAFTITLSF